MNKKIKIIVMLFFYFLFLLYTGVDDNYSKKSINNNSEESLVYLALFAYNNFLTGEVDARDEGMDNMKLSMYDIFRFDDENDKEHNKYAFFDMNGDSIPELLLRSVGPCYVLTFKNNELVVWNDSWSHTKILNSGNQLNEHKGASCLAYIYTFFNFDGSEKCSIEFSILGDAINGEYGEDCTYVFDEVEVEKSIWEQLTKKYLNESDDKIDW
jgi:hypothetical protein